MKRVIFAAIGIILVILMGYTLFKNKKSRDAAKNQEKEVSITPVNALTLKSQMVNSDFSYIGSFAPNREVPIGAETQGRVIKVYVKEGDYVKQGQVIAKVDDETLKLKLSAEEAAVEMQRSAMQTAQTSVNASQNGLKTAQSGLQTAQSALASAQTILAKAKKDAERFENLMKENATTDVALQNAKMGVTQAESGVNQANGAVNQANGAINQAEMGIKQAEMQVEQAKFGIKQAETQVQTTKDMLKKTEIVAPISGVITQKTFDMGSMVGAGVPLGMITDVSILKLQVMVPESDILKFKIGQPLDLGVDVYENETFAGNVSLVSVKSDNSHAYKMEINVPNGGSKPLKAGMYGRVLGKEQMQVNALFIPRNALVGSIKDPQVYVIQGNKAFLKPITLGISSGDLLEVKTGVNEGAQIVTSGQINLEDGMEVKVID